MENSKTRLLTEAALTIALEAHERYRSAVLRASLESLNWRPAPETSSIYSLVHHALNAQRWWLAQAVGEEFQRYQIDRAAEFSLGGGDVNALLQRIDQAESDVRSYLNRFTAHDLTRPLRRRTEPVTGAWALMHALEHPQEHIAQIELTLQMWESKGRVTAKADSQ